MIERKIAGAYVGRFAPSPSGPLHFGSLVCALASYLDAKANSGEWLVRIEDIDTPRIDAKMSHVILDSLAMHGMVSDREVIFQSERHDLYDQTLQKLDARGLLYACACSRKQIKARSGFYDGHCRNKQLTFTENSLRFINHGKQTQFVDAVLQLQNIKHPIASEDPVLKRRDGIYAYHLAVVADDIEQGITHIVRGVDLVDTTPIHLSLYNALDASQPLYAHIPVVSQKVGQKLSKQHHSPAIDDTSPIRNLHIALNILGITIKDKHEDQGVSDIIASAIEQWQIDKIPRQREVLISTTNNVYSLV